MSGLFIIMCHHPDEETRIKAGMILIDEIGVDVVGHIVPRIIANPKAPQEVREAAVKRVMEDEKSESMSLLYDIACDTKVCYETRVKAGLKYSERLRKKLDRLMYAAEVGEEIDEEIERLEGGLEEDMLNEMLPLPMREALGIVHLQHLSRFKDDTEDVRTEFVYNLAKDERLPQKVREMAGQLGVEYFFEQNDDVELTLISVDSTLPESTRNAAIEKLTSLNLQEAAIRLTCQYKLCNHVAGDGVMSAGTVKKPAKPNGKASRKDDGKEKAPR